MVSDKTSKATKARFAWPSWPQYGARHYQSVLRVIKSNQLFAAQEVAKFEKQFAAFVGAKNAIGVGNATQGLHLSLAALGVGPGDEVVVTPYSWISSASCVLMQGAVPVFADIETETFGMCPKALEAAINLKTKAVVLVHMFGLASQVDKIQEICKSFNIYLIEDASHGHGAKFNGKNLGTFGNIGVFSLHQRKAISTGDGGILCTDNSDLCAKIKRLRSFGDNQLSFNYRMTEFSAALGQIGLRQLNAQNKMRQKNHYLLAKYLNNSHIRVVEAKKNVEPVFTTNLLKTNIKFSNQEKIIRQAQAAGVPLKRTWQPLHWHPHFKKYNMPKKIAPWAGSRPNYVEPSKTKLPNSELYQTKKLLELDCNPFVKPEQVIHVAKWLSKLIQSEIKI